MRYSLICLGLVASACTEVEPPKDESENYTDADGDGYGFGADCDDADATVYPTAPELCDGLDNNCNGEIDDNPGENGVQAWTDADGDGFGDPDTEVWTCDASGLATVGGDCNDGSDAIHPDADEVCDERDNDCDGLVDALDDSTVGLVTFYQDADGDGFGGENALELCDAMAGYVDNADDCDDFDSARSPAFTEISCDGVDNDCDDVVDLNVVPRDYGTVQAAVDALADNDTVCLTAGTYVESVDVTGRRLTVMNGGAAADVILEVGSQGSFFEIDNWDETADAPGAANGKLKVQNVTVTGSASATGGLVQGAFLNMRGGDASVRNVVFDGISVTADDSTVSGGLIHSRGSSLTVDAVSVSDLSYDLSSATDSTVVLGGFLMAGDGSDVTVTNTDFSGTMAMSSSTAGELAVVGLAMYAEDTLVAMDAVTATDTQIALAAVDVLVDGAVFGGFDLVGGTMSNISVTGSSVSADATAESVSYGVWTIVDAEGAVSLDSVEVSESTIALTTTDGDALAYGVLNAEGVPSVSMNVVDLYSNTVSAARTGTGLSRASGALSMEGTGGSIQYLDVRGTSVSADDEAVGGGIWLSEPAGAVHLTNAILAGNSLNAGTGVAMGAGMSLAYEDAASESVTLTNVTMHGNSIVAAGEALGGSLAATIGGTDALSVTNTAIGASSVTGTVVEGIAVYVGDATALGAWSYNALIEEAVDCEEVESVDDGFFFGIVDPTCDDNGNVRGDAFYAQDRPEEDPTTWDFSYNNRSILRDAGAPEVLDADGSRSDIGALGGPGSDGW